MASYDDIPLRLWLTDGRDTLTVGGPGDDMWHVAGSTGLLGAPRSVRWSEGAADGGKWLGTRAKTRPILLKLAIHGTLARQRETIERLRAICLSEDFAIKAGRKGGRPDRWLPVVYESGLEGAYSADAANTALTAIDLAMTSPTPWWVGEERSISWLMPTSNTAFLTRLSSLPVGAGSATRSQTITIGGERPAPVCVAVSGPATRIGIACDGMSLTVSDLGGGEQIAVVYDWRDGSWSVADQSGADAYARLDAGSRMPVLDPGDNTVTIVMEGTTGGSSGVRLRWNELTEGVR